MRSHSWHDDKETKFRQWEVFFANFRETHGRSALVWLDEIIINQGNIEDSLKCLPVYLMACKKLLVLCGDTYADRLWCIWSVSCDCTTSTHPETRLVQQGAVHLVRDE
jgi:hypothetical protein